jgi:Family of unknown function (DUF6111)
MARVLFQYLLPIVLPTAIYLLWLAHRRRRAAAAGTAVPAWQKGPWFWLIVGGLAISAASFVTGALLSGHSPSGKYVPAEVKDGRVIPGQIKD